MEFHQPCGLEVLLWMAVRTTPPGDSFTLTFSLADALQGIVGVSVELLEDIALRQRIGLQLEPGWPNRLRVTRLSDAA